MDTSVVLKDPIERLNFTLESIDKWLKISPSIRLIICDGSDYDFTKTLTAKYPDAIQNNRIECLHFMNEVKQVATFGKGFGEGEIIQYALKHSKLLQSEDTFCKCTGKLWVDNFFECLSEWNGRFLFQAYFSNVFSLKKTSFDYVDTRFYIVNKALYKKYFLKLHKQVGGHFHCSIEDIFKAVIIENKFHGSLFINKPLLRGVGGGSGKYYRDNFIRRNKEHLRLRLVQSDPTFSRWFNQG